ncbi:MAG: AAA family ATPase, partial [Patescibacteria group bacterium]
MYLQRIEVQGFKSFANKTVLEFPAPGKGCLTSPNVKSGKQLPRGICGTTAIVGPNGSGKSNIVDAVRWVLGEQSLKLLRGKKATDVIFSGSAKKAQMGLAEVSLYLNNEDQSAPVDYTEIAITRRIYRDGESDYLLNKHQVRLFDIVMLLAKANFGQNTYSVIGQGMVDKIVNYSNEERKEFFDEATGVKQYQIKRDRSVSKLRRSRENMEQVQAIVTELDPHLKSLTRQVNRLRKRQEVEGELRVCQEKHYGKLWLDLDAAYRELAMTFTSQEKEKMKLEEKIDERQEKIDLLHEQNSRHEDFNKLQREYDLEISKRNELLKSLAEGRGKLDVEYLKIGKQDLGWLENRRNKLLDELKVAESQLAELSRQVERFQNSLKEKSEKQVEFLKEFRSLEEKLLALQKEFKSELGISEKEIRASINRIYSLEKDFVERLKTTHDLDGLSKLKEEAVMVFSEIDSFYQRITKTEKQKQSEEMADLQDN